MGDVLVALQGYESALAERGHDLRSTVLPGLDEAEVANRFSAAGIEAIDDLMDWYRFVGGLVPTEPDRPRLSGLFGGLELTSLERSLEVRGELLDPDAPSNLGIDREAVGEPADGVIDFQPSWVPISAGKATAFVELAPGSDLGTVRVLWTDEPWTAPRRLGRALAPWVRRLTASIDDDVFAYRPTGQVLLENGYFPVGTLDIEDRDLRRLTRIADDTAIPSFDRLVLRYPGPGVQPENAGRELEQVAVIEGELRANGFAQWTIDAEPTDERCPNPDLCQIDVYGGLKPTS